MPGHTVERRYNVMQYIMILHPARQWQQQNINKKPKKIRTNKRHTISHPYGELWVSLAIILGKISHVIMALHCSYTTEPLWWEVNVVLGNDLVPSSNKPFLEPMSTQFFVAIFATLTRPKLFVPAVMYQNQLEQLERLRSEDTPRRPMITHTID